jgi:monofunctional biosynthetic peptidoglycan transglycosylase
VKTKGLFPRIWRLLKRVFLVLFIGQFVYILLLKWVDPPFTATQLGDWLSGYGLKRDYVNATDISRNAQLAVISSEDQLFADHSGFDWKSIEKAMAYNTRKPGRIHGGSTISQQTAKNVFLWQGRSWIRKAMETYFTFMIEHIWGKKRILEVYLNVIEMGPGVFGIEAASRHYYKKPAKSLTRSEAARIAACLPNPKKFIPQPAGRYVSTRGLVIQRQMSILAEDTDIQAIMQ